jgi:hypothetical protein
MLIEVAKFKNADVYGLMKDTQHGAGTESKWMRKMKT